jgi:hypothetical protein
MALVAFRVREVFLPILIHPYIHIVANKTQSMVSAIRTQKTACSGSSLKMGMVTSHPWDNAGANSVTWPPNFANENTTTPSLTSDNDHERDDSHDEHTPPTPPGAHSHVLHHIREPKEVPEVHAYRESHDESNLQGLPSMPSQASSMADIFARRPPTSPLPPDTPRKPYRPSKARRSPRLSMSVIVVNNMPCLTNASAQDSSNPLLVGQPPKRDLRESFRPFAQNGKGRRSRSQRKQTRLYPSSGAQHIFRSHRRTLDEELRHAVKSLHSIGAEEPLDYDECDAFIGVGSREKSCNTTSYMNDNAIHTENKVK